jgi:hypothetical protein
MSEQRLDELAASLGRTRPALDDIARARIAAGIQAAHDGRGPARRERRVPWLVAGGIAAALALAVGIALRPRPAGRAAAGPAPAIARLPDGVPLLAAGDATVSGELAQATVTLYGRGWATYQGPRLTVEAEAFLVDRTAGDAPVEVAARGATIRVLHATFAVASASELRVTVIRGEVALRCPGAEATNVVTAGQAARCEPPPPAPPAASMPGAPPPPVAPPPPAAPPGEPPPAPAPRAALTAAGADPVAAPAPRAAPSAPLAASAGAASAAGSAVRPERSAPRFTAGDAASLRAIAPGSAEPAPATALHADPAARYAEAERLMASDADAARRALRALVSDTPGAPEAAPALLDLARLAAAGGDHAAARAALDELAGHPAAAALAMPAAYLRCLVTPGAARRRACFAGFRARFPGSPHDADALAWLAAAAAGSGECPAALALIGEFLDRYPDAPAAPAIRAWKARCDRAASP